MKINKLAVDGKRPDELPVIKTAGGCTCKHSWAVEQAVFTYPNNCVNAIKMEKTAWCFISEKNCAGKTGTYKWDYCTPLSKNQVVKVVTGVKIPENMTETYRSPQKWGKHGDMVNSASSQNQYTNQQNQNDFAYNNNANTYSNADSMASSSPSKSALPSKSGLPASASDDYHSSQITAIDDRLGRQNPHVDSINNGVSSIYDSGSRAAPNSVSMNSVSSINSGVSSINSGVSSINSGMSSINSGMSSINSAASISSSASDQLYCAHGYLEGNRCVCKRGFSGMYCDECAKDFFNYPSCSPKKSCACVHGNCDYATGECVCPINRRGKLCEYCSPNFHGSDCSPVGTSSGKLKVVFFLGLLGVAGVLGFARSRNLI